MYKHLNAARLRTKYFDAMVAVESDRARLFMLEQERVSRDFPVISPAEAQECYDLRERIRAAEHMIRCARTFRDIDPNLNDCFTIESWNEAVDLLSEAMYGTPRI